ncbi:sulfatase [uncultured Trichococcus sp.]|uniref:sulfatase n=1 Tax=uncultured Trichococcus sp. TaxID=189665 RepID=UPI0029C8D3B3|nr:sulfatase [uncultured Trichococcus sp.]
MRAIMLMFDTLSRNYLPNYGNLNIKAPNFKRLENYCIAFERFYGGSMPCMPARRELHTGKYNFLHRSWGPLEPFDLSVFELMNQKGIYTHLITDHSHYWEDGGATYHNRYSSWEGFRGQEGDRWVPRMQALQNENHNPLNKKGISVTQHFANRTKQLKEEEMSTVRTIDAGVAFLDHHKNKDDWFVQIECFDPHEPFYVPDKYRTAQGCTDKKDFLYWPAYQEIDSKEISEDIKDARNEYTALIAMCDFHLGRVLDFMDENDMWEDTMLIVNTDHGFLIGEHDWMGKNASPMYEEIVHLPFFIHLPEYEGARIRTDNIAQTIDIAPTLLDYFGLDIPENMEGHSILRLIKENAINHETILFGVHGGQACIYDGQYVYMRASANEDNEPLVNYTLIPTMTRGFMPADSLKEMKLVAGMKFSNGIPVLRIPMNNYYNSYKLVNLLFDLEQDPLQENPITDERLEKRMIEKLIAKLEEIEAPEEEYIRLGLR